ncbi:MAG: response regulator [Anaerolineae bacterium]|nr:MAG: response regulator [Anaerolineae bacterium]
MSQKSVESQEGGPTRAGRVLMVDDTPENSLYLFNRLEEEGWKPRRVGNSEDGEAAFASNPELYAVVLIDLGLPPYPGVFKIGLSLVERIRHLAPHVAIAGYSEKNVEPTEAARRLQLSRASFFVLGDQKAKDVLIDSLGLLVSSWLMYSPSSANSLPEVIAREPDPLKGNSMHWRVARILTENPDLKYTEIAPKFFPEFDANYIGQIAHEIFERLELPRKNRRRELHGWYKRNRYRYGQIEKED